MSKKSVIFICSFNSARSPIAEGFLKNWNDGNDYSVFSAGIAPTRVRPYAVAVMRELNIDISGHIPASLYQYRNEHFDYVITLCDNAKAIAEDVLKDGDRFINHSFVSPQEIGNKQEIVLEEYRYLRDRIKEWMEEIFPKESPTNANNIESPNENGLPVILSSGAKH